MRIRSAVIAIASHPAHPVNVTRGMIIAGVLVSVALVTLVFAISLLSLRRSRSVIRAALDRAGYDVLRMNYRHLRLGPFSLLNTSRGQAVYRVLVRDRFSGAQLTVWARQGRTWLTSPEKLDFRCDDAAAAARLGNILA